MADDASAPGAGNAIADTAPASDELSVAEAMELYAQSEPKAPDEGDGESADDAAAVEKELAAKEADDGPPEKESPVKETEDADPEAVKEDELPPIEPPRSWTKEEKEEFLTYPRAAQEKIAAREQARETALRRTQNEAAEIRKAAEAERTKAEQARSQYEAKIPALVKTLEDALQSDFADIQNLADVRKLQAEDPFRFQQWQLRQMELSAAKAEQDQATKRQSEEQQTARANFVREQEAKLVELIPDMKDPAKANELRTKAVSMLVDDYGFTEGELGAVLQSDAGFKLLNDARWQKLIADGLKYAEIRKAPAKAVPKPVPPVQKPGTAKPAGAQNSATIQALTRKLETSGSVDDAFALFEAQQRRAS